MRQLIKEALLNQLGHDTDSVVKDAGMCLAIIAAVELPNNLWSEFLVMMANNSTNENQRFRLAAVQTLGQTMEFVEQYDRRLDNNQVGQVLHAMILNIDQQNMNLTKIAIEALLRTIPLTRDNFAVDDQREFILTGLFKAAMIDDESIQEKALEAIAETPFVGYQQADSFIPRVGELTLNLINTDRYSVIRQAFYFWTNLAKEERRKQAQGVSRNFIGAHIDALADIIQRGLMITQLDADDHALEEAENDSKLTVMNVAEEMLQEVSALQGSVIIERMVAFASSFLQKDDWLNQYIGMSTLVSSVAIGNPDAVFANCNHLWGGIFALLN